MRIVKEKWLKWIDEKINDFLTRNVSAMPKRWKKFVAYFYTDAVVRKLYWRELNVFMGENTFANIGMIADATETAPVVIGNNVSIAPYVTFISSSNPNNGREIQSLPYIQGHCIKDKKIVVEDEAWIGANATILPGVTIGRCSVIGAGAVVIKDVEPYCIYAGVPAKKLRSIGEQERSNDK